ncbi:MAG: hypothetical protein EU541_02495 [Promethearchaeota archaeon]|nr:MAG: hypothetical protein EU541_02495 [Candidatus Lokiarchaeota archaeon]
MSIHNNSVVTSIDDILRCSTLSSLLEVSGWPKPGNIHRTQDFTNTRFEHFLAAISAIQPTFRNLCNRIKKGFHSQEHNFNYVELGLFFKNAAEQMMNWQNGGNVILGHILILAPLLSTAVICLLRKSTNRKDFNKVLRQLIEDTTVQDTVELYKAINICNPGGLGEVSQYDVNDKDSIKQIQEDNITLKKIFELSQHYDLISSEYSTGFNIILTEGLPFYFRIFDKTQDINISTVHTFLKLLSNHNDTLIRRKSGTQKAQKVSKQASKILKLGGLLTEEGRTLMQKMDKSLQSEHGQLNPGTIADLLAGVIFCALIFGLKF